MNISPINNTNLNFNGKVITKGSWTPALKKAFQENIEVRNVAQKSNYDIIGILTRMRTPKNDLEHFQGDNLYKLTIAAMNEKPTWKEKLNAIFNKYDHKAEVTENYHSEEGIVQIMESALVSHKIRKKLNII